MKSGKAVTVSAAIKGFLISHSALRSRSLHLSRDSVPVFFLSLPLLLRLFDKQTPRTQSIVGAPCGAN